MNFRLVIQRERPEKDIQIFALNIDGLRQAAEVTLANLPSGAMASLYQTKETRIGVVRIERKDEKVFLVPVQLELEEKEETAKEESRNEAGNEASDSADNTAGK